MTKIMTTPSKMFELSYVGMRWFTAIAVSSMWLICVRNASGQDLKASPPIAFKTQDGRFVCAVAGSVSQIPGESDMFVGRSWGFGTLDYCHRPSGRDTGGLVLFHMDWQKNQMTMTKQLFAPSRPPAKEPLGIWSAYDPYVVRHEGEVWVAFECAVPGSVSSCIAPLTKDLQQLDTSRLSIVVRGDHRGSASTPVLLSFQHKLFVYWTIDAAQNQLASNTLISRGMQLAEDARGKMWGVGSAQQPVQTDDPRLTTLVDDVDKDDPTRNHVAHLRAAYDYDGKILAISTLGGTAGGQVCASPHQSNAGCWRMSLSVTSAPLKASGFREKVLTQSLNNTVDYPRIATSPAGRKLLMAEFETPRVPGPTVGQPQVPSGIRYISLETVMANATEKK